MESENAIAGNSILKLSEQELLDCASGISKPCDGADHTAEWSKYASDNGGLNLEEEYRYAGKSSGNCNSVEQHYGAIEAEVERCNGGRSCSSSKLQEMVSRGVVVAHIASDNDIMKNYQSGVIGSGCTGDANHFVNIVGYNLNPKKNYFIGRNSWGHTWGEDGYFRISNGNPTLSTKGYCKLYESVFMPKTVT